MLLAMMAVYIPEQADDLNPHEITNIIQLEAAPRPITDQREAATAIAPTAVPVPGEVQVLPAQVALEAPEVPAEAQVLQAEALAEDPAEVAVVEVSNIL